MAVGRITGDTVKAAIAGVRDLFLWDDRLPGFGLKVTPTGTKVFILQYRMGGRGHKTRRFKIGTSARWKAEQARAEAKRLLSDVDRGIDIGAKVRDERRIAVDLAFKGYVTSFAQTTLKAEWPKSWQDAKRCLEIHAVPHLGEKPLPDVTTDDVRRLLKRLDSRPATRRNLFATLSYMFNKSVRDGLIAESPLKALDPPAPVAERSRALGDDELRWFWSALEQEARPYRDAVELLALLGQRRSEVGELPWSELSRERREWHLSAKRSKNGCENIIPLTDAMLARFDALAGGTKWPRSGLVFPSREGTPISGWSKFKRRLDLNIAKAAKEAGAELEPWKLHDLRRTVATHMQRLGIRHETIEHLLNHREKARTGIAKVYQTHDFKPEKLTALQRWEAELDRIVTGAEARVVRLRA